MKSDWSQARREQAFYLSHTGQTRRNFFPAWATVLSVLIVGVMIYG